MLRHASFLLASLLLAACSSTTIETAPPPANDGQPPEDAPVDATPKPPPSLTFARSDVAIDPGRDHHTTMVIETASGPWLYVVGGTDAWQLMHNDVQRARIGKDGKLGAFESAG